MPVSIIESNISDSAFRVYSYLKYLGFRVGVFKIRYDLMAKILRKSKPTCYRAVAELRRLCVLCKTEGGWIIYENIQKPKAEPKKRGTRRIPPALPGAPQE
jgi:hypothetical protein